MKALEKKTRIALIVGAVVFLLLLVVLLYFQRQLIKPVLITLLIVGLAFLALEGVMRWRKRRKQKAFDEKVSAKEGIDDRRREWSAWIEELDRQGLDRYELPFYMIVGEPQSGKSVLLQNSDLHFPFGQDKLSGVGGTRGCDWWFTDEAVILDIAGRLFTHEGGVADRMEWEAFLDLLYEFRPLCPANGILLVVPCDALAADSREDSTEKANKIQAALLTMSERVQAQVPIYLVLTKADQVFGFAESVHKLDTKSRQEMFGWSRPAEDVDSPFDITETRAGFDTLVDRAQLLRERMVASARLPEALPEIDRLYAFPDELAALWDNLEIYLKRVFTESALTGATSFRGIYLTSGLQAGVPIAKVCGDLLGESSSGDKRLLEKLFTQQRAYFIKDLIRQRVFAERGLVRPTEGRVLRSRRNAMLGYGVSAALALLATAGAIWHVATARPPAEAETYARALEAAENVENEGVRQVSPVLASLARIDAAIGVEGEVMSEAFGATRDKFRELFTTLFDERLIPALMDGVQTGVDREIDLSPADYDRFERLQDGVALLIEPEILPTDRGYEAAILSWTTDVPEMIQIPDPEDERRELTHRLTLKEAFERRRELAGDFGESVYQPSGDQLRASRSYAKRVLDLWDEALDAAPWQPDTELGVMIAWRAQEELHDKVVGYTKSTGSGSHFLGAVDMCTRYGEACRTLEHLVLEKDVKELEGGTLITQVKEISNLRARFVAPELLAAGGEIDWPVLEALSRFVADKMEGADKARNSDVMPSASSIIGGRAGLLATRMSRDLIDRWTGTLDLPTGDMDVVLKASALTTACVTGPVPEWTPEKLAADVALQNQDFNPDERRALAVREAKWRDFSATFPGRYRNWSQFVDAFPAEAEAGEVGLASDLANVRNGLVAWSGMADGETITAMSDLLEGFLGKARADDTFAPSGGSIDWERFHVLTAIAGPGDLRFGGAATKVANELRWTTLFAHLSEASQDWQFDASTPDAVERSLDEFEALVVELERNRLVDRQDVPASARVGLAAFEGWLANRDAEVAAVLESFSERLGAAWQPESFPVEMSGGQLAMAVEKIANGEDQQRLLGELADAESIDPSNRLIRESSPIALSPTFPKTARAMALLRGFRMPEISGWFKDAGNAHGRAALDLAREVGRVGMDLPSLAATLADKGLEPLETGLDALETGPGLYSEAVWEAVETRCHTMVYAAYLKELNGALQSAQGLLDDLWRDPDETEAREKSPVILRLEKALHPESGWFSKASSSYRMDSSEELLPYDAASTDDDPFPKLLLDVDQWKLERFLRGLREFLYPESLGQDRLLDESLELTLSIPRGERDTGAWDTGQYPWCFSCAVQDPKSDARSRLSGSSDAKVAWTFTKNACEFWIRWSLLPQSDGELRDEDLEYRSEGVLVPLLIAWKHERSQKAGPIRRVELEAHSKDVETTKAVPLVIDFEGRVLPRRPDKPSR